MLCRAIRDKLRHEIKMMYGSSDHAFGALDFTGVGYVTEEAFLNSIFVKERQPYSIEQIRLFFRDQSLFNKNNPVLVFDNFKKIFYPHHY